MYYVLTLYHDVRHETYCLEDACVYSCSGRRCCVSNGCIAPQTTVKTAENATIDWSSDRARGKDTPIIIVWKDGTVDTGFSDEYGWSFQEDEVKTVINQLAPVRHVDVCAEATGIMAAGRKILVIDCAGKAWLIDHERSYGPPYHVPTAHPVTFGAEVDFFTIVILGPVTWKVRLHKKLPRHLRKVFRMLLLSSRRLKVDFTLFYRVGGMI